MGKAPLRPAFRRLIRDLLFALDAQGIPPERHAAAVQAARPPCPSAARKAIARWDRAWRDSRRTEVGRVKPGKDGRRDVAHRLPLAAVGEREAGCGEREETGGESESRRRKRA